MNIVVRYSSSGRLFHPCQTRISERNIIEYIFYAHINANIQILILMNIIIFLNSLLQTLSDLHGKQL